MSDLAYLDVATAAGLLKTKKLSPLEYARGLIERIEKHDRNLNAFLRFTPDLALEDARRAEAEIANGQWRGTWHGIPYALKDIVDYAGLPTTAHSKILQNNIARTDAVVAQRFRTAGATFLGKLSTHEFATGGPSFDLPWPPARNPWNRDHFPGGSSSGAGAATAAGFAPAAIGTDTAGSIRNPATMCGIVGMKPTYGLVSRRGVVPLAFSLDHVGPMTRTVRDNALLLDLIAGHDPEDPASCNRATGGYTALLGHDIKGMRIGVIRHFYTRDMQADAEMTEAIEAALKTLTGLGAEVREVQTAPLDEFAACNRIILTAEAFAIHENWMRERPQDYGALARERIMAGAFVRAADYVNATRLRRKLSASFHTLFDDIDVVLTASSMDPACRIDDPAALERTYPRQARAPFNVTGSPGLSVPAGFSKAGLPLGIQLVGKPFSEATLYRVAYAYEQATPWRQRRAPLGD
ncbi:MAG: Asp-tRNA(Asn)/Glu-tRNA(Gln) amidotransferase subunit GatA [Betaproteobacteria bacterium]|nr:MAG: Asp-tRNA(Asn)/Glu-tRNA(Gln) amidotransferase subunit GatA [Betaproteobacteria bacterium]